MSEHSTRPVAYTIVALLVLTLISYAVTHVGFGAAATPVALAIATVKAAIVAWMFMELPHASLPARVVALVTLSFIALLCLGTVGDLAFR